MPPARWSAEDVERFNQGMREQKLHAWMGVSLVSQEDGAAVCRMAVDENTDGGGGYLHGGLAEVALDVVAWFAAIPESTLAQPLMSTVSPTGGLTPSFEQPSIA